MFRGRFYREHCVYDPDLGVYAKNLCDVLRMRQMIIDDAADRHSIEGMPIDDVQQNNVISASSLPLSFPCDERRVVLVDNNPLSFLPNPSNGILVSSFYDDPKDDTLEAVMELLHELDRSDDVRPILNDKFGLKDALEDIVKGGSIKW
jgi:CTD small phosphatase-like protein 2